MIRPETLQTLSLKAVRAVIPTLFLAWGVTLGGGLIGALGEWLVGQADTDPTQIAFRVRIWAVAIAIGGTMTAFEHIERGLARGALPQIVRDILVLGAAYGGAQAAIWCLRALVGR